MVQAKLRAELLQRMFQNIVDLGNLFQLMYAQRMLACVTLVRITVDQLRCQDKSLRMTPWVRVCVRAQVS